MHNDVDDRRGAYDEADDQRRRYEAADDRSARYQEGDHEQYDDRYQEAERYQEPYEDFGGDGGYDEPPRRRSRLVPILTIVASLLAVAIAAVVVLYVTGFFEGGGGPATSVATDEATPIDLTPDTTAPPPPDISDDVPLPPDGGSTTVTPDVRDAAVSIAPPAQGEPPVRSSHGDWQVRCDTPAGAKSEQCVLMQFVTAEDRDNVGLTVIVLKTADGKARLMRVLAPLGVLLPSGLGLKIDETDIGRAGFVRCLPNGCVAEVILEDTLLDQLEKGNTATFIIFQTPEEGIGIPISLAGFNEGFQALP